MKNFDAEPLRKELYGQPRRGYGNIKKDVRVTDSEDVTWRNGNKFASTDDLYQQALDLLVLSVESELGKAT
jgi:hypothetical protein